MSDNPTPTPAPAEALVKLERLNQETTNHIISLLEKDVLPNLQADISSYAKGRMRVWMPYEAPLDSPNSPNRPFIPGLLHDELWQFIVDLCAKHGFTAQLALASKGGSIKPHRDTTYAAAWSFGINLGECDWQIASTRDSAKPDYSMHLTGGEVFKFNSKHTHAVVNAKPDRWAINVWAIADTQAANKANIQERLQSMLNENPHVVEFIQKHKPTTNGEDKPMKEETAQQKLKRLTQEIPIQPQKKGTEMISFMNDFFHTITNDPTPQESLGYTTSQKTNKPYKMGTTTRTGADGDYNHNLWMMPINNGDTWSYGLLEHKLNNRGKKFKLKMITINDLKTWTGKDSGDLDALIEESNFAWANATHAFFLKTRDDDNWTLSDLGIGVIDMKKTSKRLQEITRFTQIYKSKNMQRLTFCVYTNEWMEKYYQDNNLSYNSSDEVMFDGPVFIRKSAMVKMCFEITDEVTRKQMIGAIHNGRNTFLARMAIPTGLIKGLWHVVEDEDISADVVYHETALKKEYFTTNDVWTFSAWPMDTSYEVSWDTQSMINNIGWLYTPERFKAELGTLLSDFTKEVASGNLPEWMKVGASTDQDGGLTNEDNELQEWQANYVKWQKNGFSLYDSSNFIHLAFGQLANRMRAAVKRDNMWLPMCNAFMAPVITHEALQIMGGQNLPESKSDLVWFDPRYGAIIPGNRFVDTAVLHDTWDQDGDMARFIRIKLWCSDINVWDTMATEGVVPYVAIPTTPEEAVDVVVIVRSPNGPGGYSINFYDAETMPFMRVNEELVQVIDLATATMPMGTLLKDTVVSDELQDIINNTQYTKRAFTRDNAKDMVIAQMSNPGFGSFANFMMVYANVYGPGYPASMPATGNDIIDASAQTANIEAFEYISSGVSMLWADMLQDIVNSDKVIDSYLLNRLPTSFNAMLYGTKHIADGPMAEMLKQYINTMKAIDQEKKNTIYLRTRSELIPMLQELIPTLTADTQAWCESFNTKYMRLLRALDEQKAERKAEETQWSSRYFKAWNAVFAADALEKVIKSMVDEIKLSSNPGKFAVALYRWMTDPKMSYELVYREATNDYVKANAHLRYGLVDRVIFQAGKHGQENMMDVLIQGLKDLGL